jgi:hypothetical protein
MAAAFRDEELRYLISRVSRGELSEAGARGIASGVEFNPEVEHPVDYRRGVRAFGRTFGFGPLASATAFITGAGFVAYCVHEIPEHRVHHAVPRASVLDRSFGEFIRDSVSDVVWNTSEIARAFLELPALDPADAHCWDVGVPILAAPLLIVFALFVLPRGLFHVFSGPDFSYIADGREVVGTVAGLAPDFPERGASHGGESPAARGAVSGVPDGPHPRGRVESAPTPVVDVQSLQARYDVVFAEYTRTELDPDITLECPAIRDVRYPTTAAFHDALTAAHDALKSAPVAPAAAEEAVKALETAWVTAMDTAYTVGVSGLDIREVRRMDAVWATATAVGGVTDAERRQARDQVVSYLDRIVDDHGIHLDGTRILANHSEHVAIAAPVRRALTTVTTEDAGAGKLL